MQETFTNHLIQRLTAITSKLIKPPIINDKPYPEVKVIRLTRS